jgi:glycerophosphoryl diester phosphodiesterase
MANIVRIAHRGASGSFPENTRLAVEKALEARADMVELDCQLSSDGHVVVFHDERLVRITGTGGAVNRMSLEQLKRLDVGAWRQSAFKGERILTLEEVVTVIDGQADLCLDIKQYPDSPPGIELKLLFVLSHYDYLDRTIFSSFDSGSLRRVRELAPEVRVGVIYGADSEENPFVVAEEVEAASLHVQKELATGEFLDKTWELGLDAFIWTVNELSDIESFTSLGVQGIMTDFPERFWKLADKP